MIRLITGQFFILCRIGSYKPYPFSCHILDKTTFLCYHKIKNKKIKINLKL